jgi:hypothetical protein
MLEQYLKDLHKAASHGDAREETYYPVLKTFLELFAQEKTRRKAEVTVLPKATEAGNPDMRVWDGRQHITGYVEAKDPSVTDLDRIENSEQLKRYRSTFPNVILTNYYEFRLYRDGERILKVQAGRPFISKKLGMAPPAENEKELFELLERFFSFSIPRIYNASQLAKELAKRTRFLRDEVIQIELKEEESRNKKDLLGFYEAFKQYLIATLTHAQFADLYAQTITYGLFAARTRANGPFNRQSAVQYLPSTIGILRDVFQFISLGNPPQNLQVVVDDIAEVLEVTDAQKILHEYFHQHKGSDPIVHFYETFLAAYDPKIRERRGVYYTPEPVVNYIVKSLHHILKEKFDKPDGFASQGVTVLDPAGGTLTFPAVAVQQAVDEYTGKYGSGGVQGFIKNHILQNFYSFELMMAPYAIGHLKMSFVLEELGYTLADDERFKLYLTNTLEMEDLQQIQIPGLSSLSEESHAAAMVKKEQPILVIMGNPPYSGHSANKNQWIDDLLKKGYNNPDGTKDEGYYRVDGKPLGERNPKWLQDDYVKFIRFAQWKIDQNGEGVLGFITNHSYLDNPTFRGMRQSLLNTFNEIHILNLHGNSLKKEKTPEGGKDENVFDIQAGVSIALMVKEKNKKGCRVKYADLFGLQKDKYDILSKHELKKTKWNELKPKSDFYLFVKQNIEVEKLYSKFLSINDIFPVNSVGVVTAKDHFAIAATENILKRRIQMFLDKTLPLNVIEETFNLKSKEIFNIEDIRNNLRKESMWQEELKEIDYRPFDKKWIIYNDLIIERKREEVMSHMLQENCGLCIGRQGQVVGSEHLWNLAFVSDTMIDFNLFYRGGGTLFPLYIYPSKQEKEKKRRGNLMMLFEPEEEFITRRPNIHPEVRKMLADAYGKEPSPGVIFYYIYSVLYSNIYRERFADFLKIDFPKIPFPSSKMLFLKLAVLGERLADLHLLKSSELNPPVARYQGSGSDRIEKVKYETPTLPPSGRPSREENNTPLEGHPEESSPQLSPLEGRPEKSSPQLSPLEGRPEESSPQLSPLEGHPEKSSPQLSPLEGGRGVSGRVYINSEKYFEGITTEVWNYHIGGYQVLHKYLKDRKGRNMDDPVHYCRIATAISKTIELQKEIDELYEGVEEGVIMKEREVG